MIKLLSLTRYRIHNVVGGLVLTKLHRILALTLGVALIMPITPSMTHAEALQKKIEASLARQAAASVVIDAVTSGETTTWNRNTRIGVVEDVYDPSEKQVAYQVHFEDPQGQDQGYALVSAFYDEEPILMWSAGQAIDEQQAKQVAMEELQSERRSLVAPEVEDTKIVWYGGARLGIEVESSTGEEFAVDNTMRAVSITDESTNTETSSYPVPTYNAANREKWEQFEDIKFGAGDSNADSDGVTEVDPATWEPTYNRIEKYYINGVTSMKQWNYTTNQATGCTPTAGSNIVMWFAKQYPSLNPTKNQRDIVMGLRTTMKTTQNAGGEGITGPTDIDNGMQTYFRNHGVPSATSQNSTLATYDEYKKRLQEHVPVLQSYWNQPYFGNHTVTVVGFKELVRGTPTKSSKYLVVKNNWSSDTADLYVKFGSWNTNVMTYTFVKGT